jgi:DNA polymerase-3 subunit delta
VASSGISIAQLRTAVEGGRIDPVYVILGSDAALRRRALAALRAGFLEASGGLQPGAFVRMDATAVPVGDGMDAVVDEARSLPLFAMMSDGPARLLWAGSFGNVKAEETDSLKAYLADPVAATCLVLDTVALDKRTTIYKQLAKVATIVDCEPPKNEGDVRRWIEATAAARGCRIDRDAVVLLTEMAGTSITALEQELEKVLLFVGDSGRITASDLEGLLGRSREHSVFELTDALVAARPRDAMRALNLLVDDGEEPIRLLAMVAWITRQLVTAHDLANSGLPQKEAMQQLGGRWDGRRRLLDRGRAATRDHLLDALRACGDTDLAIKRLRDARPGGDRLRPARGALEALCRQICAA